MAEPQLSTATATYSCVEGGWAGTGNIEDNPAFARLPTNLRRTALSPGVRGGDAAKVIPPAALDLDGDPRLSDVDFFDIDEFVARLGMLCP